MTDHIETAKSTAIDAKERGSKTFDLEEQFSAYGAYHTNKVNINIHVCCVPMIFWSATILLNMAWPVTFATVGWQLAGYEGVLKVTPGFLLSLGYASYFVMLEPVAGLLYAPILLSMGYSSSPLSKLPQGRQIATVAHIVSWLAQFVGHGAFEGRAPALLDNLLQSLVLAVFFVWLEVLFYFGYRPELHKRLNNRIGVRVAEFRKHRAAQKKAS